MVFNASSADALEKNLFHKTHNALIRQLFNFGVGVIICLPFWYVDYREWIKISPLLLFLVIITLLMVFVPGIGRCVNGARRWIVIGNFVGQPSEFVKVVLPLFFIQKIVGENRSSTDLFKIFLFILVPLVLVMIEPSNGLTAMLGATFIILLFLSRVSYKWWLWPILIFSIMGTFAVIKVPYIQARIQSYLHPEQDLLGRGHQPFQSKIATGSGGVLGRGLGKSIQKLNYLPEAQNDYIAAIFAEEMGFLGMSTLIFFYMFIGFLGFSIALKVKDVKGAILGASLTFSLCLQAFLNLAVVSGLMPSTGLNLPFFSQGGSSLLANMILVTLVLNIAKTQPQEESLLWLKKS
ncbi:MAG: putative peptidoglycan glycosyltransferase FtsW [Chlamydiae bacterium]|nr:putative peptidoglycan glycosyltransferase FtsW [Chlamydiota bacterium]